MQTRRGAIFPGLILILIGAWLLARNLGVELLPLKGDLSALWPGFLLLGGLAFLSQFLLGGRRDDGLVFVGVAATLVGLFFFAFTFGYLAWGDMGRYWPVFVLIGGLAFLAQWLVRPTQRELLIPAFIALIVGFVALALTLRVVNPALADQIVKLWPVLLILAGLLTLGSYFLRTNRPSS
jgi:hypothetical protein